MVVSLVLRCRLGVLVGEGLLCRTQTWRDEKKKTDSTFAETLGEVLEMKRTTLF